MEVNEADRKRFFALAIVPILLTVALCGCLGNEKEGSKGDTISDKYGSRANDLVASSNSFAFKLNEALGSEGNMVFSPYSLLLALAMVYEGARGDTADEMQSVLGIPTDGVARHDLINKTLSALNDPNKYGEKYYELICANSFWAQQNYPLKDEYLSILRNYYRANGSSMDFGGDPEGSAKQINEWIAATTKNKIKDMIAPQYLSAQTILVLANAIYLKATWSKKFDPAKTEKEDFRSGSGDNVMVDMMKKDADANRMLYGEMDGKKIVYLPYSGGMGMYLVMPKDSKADLSDLDIGEDSFAELHDSLRKSKVDLWMPKFEIESGYDMEEIFVRLGMESAFNPHTADLSGIDGSKNLFIDKLFHRSLITVDEEGTEAAAASVAIVTEGIEPEPPKETFHADHPFLFVIQEGMTGEILFMGKVEDPR